MFGFFKKKGPPPLPVQRPPEPPPLPASAVSEETPVPWHSYVFAASFIPHMLLNSRKALFSSLAMDGAINLLWMTAGMAVPENLRRSAEEGLLCKTRSGDGYLVLAIKLPKIRFPFEVQYSVSIFGPCNAQALNDPEWEMAEFQHFFLLAGMVGLEVKKWGQGGSITRGMWSDDLGLDAFVAESWKLSHDPNAIAFIASTDHEMSAAMTRAKNEFPRILKHYQAGELKDLGLKVAIRDDGKVEHFWLSNARIEHGKLVGNIEGPVKSVTNVKDGELVKVDFPDLSDWSHMKEGKLYGAYTLRVLLPTMNPTHAAQIRAVLADD